MLKYILRDILFKIKMMTKQSDQIILEAEQAQQYKINCQTMKIQIQKFKYYQKKKYIYVTCT